MSSRTVEAILRLSSKVGRLDGFRRVSGEFDKIDRRAKAFNRSQAAIIRTSGRMQSALLAYAAPAAIVAGATAATRSFAAIERRMNRIGIAADASAEETETALDRVRQIATDVSAPVENVVDALDGMVASGKSMREALDLLPSVAGASQAADAEFAEMATTADAIGGAFKIAAGEMEGAFDIIAKGGKEGKFELKDMAAELPSLAPAFASLGYEGEAGLKRLVAALQTVRLETGTSGEAATAFMDVLTKMESQTVTNNFKRFGVDIRQELEKARDSGEDLLDAFLRLSDEAVGGDLAKLPQLFTDKQMLIATRALIRHREELEKFADAMSNASGTVATDLKRIVSDTQSAMDEMGNVWRTLREDIGESIAPTAVSAMQTASGALKKDRAIRNSRYWQEASPFERMAFTFQTTADERNAIARSAGYVIPGDEALAKQDPAMYQATAFAAMPPRITSTPPSLYAGPKGGLFEAGMRQQSLGMNMLAGAESKMAGSAMTNTAHVVSEDFDRSGEKVAHDLGDGGERAARAIGDSGREAGDALREGADAIREAALEIRRSASALSPSPSFGKGVSGVRGRTMPHAGRTQQGVNVDFGQSMPHAGTAGEHW